MALPRALVLLVIVATMVACTSGSKQESPPPSPIPIVAGVVIDELQQARRASAENEARSLLAAVQLHLANTLRCPADVEALASSRVIQKVPVDPWGHGYEIECTGDGASVIVVSLGEDGERRTADDILVETHEF